jgi:hypothetical protein
MASKMPTAHDVTQQLISIDMAEKAQFTKPLCCVSCEAVVSFVNAYTRQVGEDIIAVEPFFRLNRGQRHSQSCRYNVHGQIAVIARKSDADVMAAIQDNRYELRLLAVSKALVQLQEIAREKKYPAQRTSTSNINKTYVDAGSVERLGAISIVPREWSRCGRRAKKTLILKRNCNLSSTGQGCPGANFTSRITTTFGVFDKSIKQLNAYLLPFMERSKK